MHALPARVQHERDPGATAARLGSGHGSREPENGVLYGIVRDALKRLEPFEHDRDGRPDFLEREFRRYVDIEPSRV